MSYEQYLKKIFRSPLALTLCIILSAMIFFQFISLFFGRWIDLVEFGGNIFLLVTLWILFSKSSPKKGKKLSASLSCTFGWLIVKLISLGMAAIGILSVSIYTCVKAGKSGYKGQMLAAGFILLIFGMAIYVMRIIICIRALIEANRARHSSEMYILKNNWFVICIILAGMRLAGMILQITYSLLAGEGLSALRVGILDILGIYNIGGSKFAGLILGSIGIGSNIFVVIIDLFYIAIFVILGIIMSKYRKNVN